MTFKLSIFIVSFLFFSCNQQRSSETKPNETTEAVTIEDQDKPKTDSCGCETTVYLNDPDTNGTNVRDVPNGKIIKKLKYESDCLCLIVEIVSAQKDWLELKDGGWVYAPLFAVGSRNYGEQNKLYLNETASEESKTTAEYLDEQEFTVLGCSGTWLYVKGKDGKKGWLTQNMQCPNPLTTCP
jgi:hypothetical protein